MIGLDLYCKATFCIYDLLKSKTVWSYRDFTIYIEDFWNYITKGKWVLISSIQKWKCFVLVTTSLPLSDIRRYFVQILYKLIYLTLCHKAFGPLASPFNARPLKQNPRKVHSFESEPEMNNHKAIKNDVTFHLIVVYHRLYVTIRYLNEDLIQIFSTFNFDQILNSFI